MAVIEQVTLFKLIRTAKDARQRVELLKKEGEDAQKRATELYRAAEAAQKAAYDADFVLRRYIYDGKLPIDDKEVVTPLTIPEDHPLRNLKDVKITLDLETPKNIWNGPTTVSAKEAVDAEESEVGEEPWDFMTE